MANKGSNWIWWTVGGISLVGIGVGTFLYFRGRKKAKAEATSALAATPTVTQAISSGIKEVVSGGEATPFKTDAEGNAFRAWVNQKYPDYARQIDLDPTGARDNSYIRKAWKKYGTEYLADTGSAAQKTIIESGAWNTLKGQLSSSFKNEVDSPTKLRYYINDRIGWNDLMVNFTPDGGFWIEDEADESKKFGGTWTFSGGVYTLKLQDGSFNSSDNEMNEMVKQVARLKFSAEADNINMDGSSVDKLMYTQKNRKYKDANDCNL